MTETVRIVLHTTDIAIADGITDMDTSTDVNAVATAVHRVSVIEIKKTINIKKNKHRQLCVRAKTVCVAEGGYKKSPYVLKGEKGLVRPSEMRRTSPSPFYEKVRRMTRFGARARHSQLSSAEWSRVRVESHKAEKTE